MNLDTREDLLTAWKKVKKWEDLCRTIAERRFECKPVFLSDPNTTLEDHEMFNEIADLLDEVKMNIVKEFNNK